MWEWLGPGGLPGLQNLWRVALRVAVGSTPIHSRLRKSQVTVTFAKHSRKKVEGAEVTVTSHIKVTHVFP
jgi:hypothetical protein